MEAPEALPNGSASRLPKLSGQEQQPPRRKASVSLHNDADLESNIKDQLAAVGRLAFLSCLGLIILTAQHSK